MNRDELAQRWPQFALGIAVGDARLQVPTDTELAVLARRAAEPTAILPTADSHFVKWLQDRTPDEIEHQRIARVTSNRELTTRPGWTLDRSVMVAGEPVGIQSLSGFEQWPHRRIVGTTSWLLAAFQRRGLGTQSRAAVLELAFVQLGAEAAKSWVLADNHASASVSAKLGYELLDGHRITEHGRQYVEHVYRLDRDTWLSSSVRRQHAPVITGAAPLVALLDR